MSEDFPVPENLTLGMVEAKEKELAERREALRTRQSDVPSSIGQEPNFPPRFLCIKPQVYHNISEQVPVDLHRFMYILYGLYMTLIGMIVFNIVAALVVLISNGSSMHFGFSFIYLLGIPGGFIVWYFNAYTAATENSRARYFLAYLGLFIAMGFDIWMAVGIPGMGGCGFVLSFQITEHTLSFILCLISSSLWSVHGAIMLVMLIRFWRYASLLPENSHYRQSDP